MENAKALRSSKAAFRSRMKGLLDSMSPETVAVKSRAIAGRLVETAWWREAEIILAFLSLPSEVDTAPLL